MGDNTPDYKDNLYFEPKEDNEVTQNLAKSLKIYNIPVVANDKAPKEKPIIEITCKDNKKVYLPLRDDVTSTDINSFIFYFTKAVIKNNYSIFYDIDKNGNDE